MDQKPIPVAVGPFRTLFGSVPKYLMSFCSPSRGGAPACVCSRSNMACCIGPRVSRIRPLLVVPNISRSRKTSCDLAPLARVWTMGVRVGFGRATRVTRTGTQMISRWATGAAIAASAITLVACGGLAIPPDRSRASRESGGRPDRAAHRGGRAEDRWGEHGLGERAGTRGHRRLASISAKAGYSIAATGIGTRGRHIAAGNVAVTLPAVATASAIVWGPRLDMSFGARLNERARSRFRGQFRRRPSGARLAARRVARSEAQRRLRCAAGRGHLHRECRRRRVLEHPEARRARGGDQHAGHRARRHAQSHGRVHRGGLSAFRGALRHARLSARRERTSARRRTSTGMGRSSSCSPERSTS